MNEARPDPEQPLAGAGLGLAICRAIARAHGGGIAAQVRPGGGARLVFTLLVDLGLPDADGIKVVRAIREWSPMPVVVLSARTLEEQKIQALDAGADDYVTKPFSAPELLARVRAALRRNVRGAGQVHTLQIGETTIDLSRRTAAAPGGEVHFTPLEYRVLESLGRQSGMIVTQRQLISEAWGPDKHGDARSLRVCIKNLRRKVEPDPARRRYLLTEAGVGYRLVT